MKSTERQHAAHGCNIRLVYFRRRTQLALPLAALFRQDMTQVRLSALETPGAGFPEALGRATIRFQLRHYCFSKIIPDPGIPAITCAFWGPAP
jgi:hypothetical protein